MVEGNLNFIKGEIRKRLNEFRISNVVFVGKAGAGKSSLINAIFDNGSLCRTGAERPITKDIKIYNQNNYALTIFDTESLNNQNYQRNQKELHDFIEMNREGIPVDKFLQLAVIVMNDSRSEIEISDLDIYHYLQENHIPVIVVLNQIMQNCKLEQTIKELMPQVSKIIQVQYQRFPVNNIIISPEDTLHLVQEMFVIINCNPEYNRNVANLNEISHFALGIIKEKVDEEHFQLKDCIPFVHVARKKNIRIQLIKEISQIFCFNMNKISSSKIVDYIYDRLDKAWYSTNAFEYIISTIVSNLAIDGIVYVGLTTFGVIKGGLEAVIGRSGVEVIKKITTFIPRLTRIIGVKIPTFYQLFENLTKDTDEDVSCTVSYLIGYVFLNSLKKFCEHQAIYQIPFSFDEISGDIFYLMKQEIDQINSSS
jgi:GTP-binding protein EngB required for normal cell division